jgi:hypothetical protein
MRARMLMLPNRKGGRGNESAQKDRFRPPVILGSPVCRSLAAFVDSAMSRIAQTLRLHTRYGSYMGLQRHHIEGS